MRTSRLITAILTTIGICFFSGIGFSSPKPLLKDAPNAQELQNSQGDKSTEELVQVYEVFGMDCPACHGAVNKLMGKISGVQKSEADWVNKKVTVTIKPGVTVNDDDVYDAIKRANFTPGKRIK